MNLKMYFKNKNKIINFIVFLCIFIFLLSYFKPSLILSKTTTAGGDTISHYYPAHYMKTYLLPNLKLIGWSPGWYAGFPIFHFYMPTCYVLMSILGYIIGLQIAFKMITILGIFLLPITSFYCFKLMKFKFPMPIVAALMSLIFLFHQGNSMWGGNIPSTLAGEFSYSLSMSVMVLLFGFLYRGIKEKKYKAENSILIALTGLTHIYTIIFAAAASSFLLMAKNKIKENLTYLFKIFLLGGLLAAFWVLPFVFKMSYASPCNYTWAISDYFNDFFHQIFYPPIILAIIGIVIAFRKKDERIMFFLYSILISIIAYLIAPRFGLTDIRFIPFMQLFIIYIGAYGLVNLTKKIKFKWLLPLVLVPLVLYWIDYNVTYIDYWIKWNYEGFELKDGWDQYNNLTTYLRELPEGRIVHEYSNEHGKFGSPRAFEMFPYFTDKPTLEGLYIESGLSAPYVFWIQSEISKTPTCPIPTMRCSYFDLENATIHLKLFNIDYLVATSDKLKNATKENNEYTFLESFEEIEVYKVNNTGNYVEVLQNEPNVMITKDWENISLEWFKNARNNDIPVIFLSKLDEKDQERFSYVIEDLSELKRIKTNADCSVSEKVSNEEILIETDCINKPLLVKISYFPNWKVEGADKVYLATPSFMIIYPEQKNVRLYYGYTKIDIISYGLSAIAWTFVLFVFFKNGFNFKSKKKKKHLNGFF